LTVANHRLCLVFTKLASQLTADKLVELGVIPFIFVVQTFVSYLAAVIVSHIFKFKKRPTNFVTAMAVCTRGLPNGCAC
jgi:predicted permease